MTSLPEDTKQHQEKIAHALHRLRNDLADGNFLRDNFYTIDDSQLAGNTHHYWIRFGLRPDPQTVIDEILQPFPSQISTWLGHELGRKILQRLPKQYSTLIKIPFSVSIGDVAEERTKQVAAKVEQRLPVVTPYAIFFLNINRLIKLVDQDRHPPSESEFDILAEHYNSNAIAKARTRYPELWDELRGHYVLDTRGHQFAKLIVSELSSRNLISDSTKFIDVGSGIGTNLFAVNRCSNAHSTGIELHDGLVRISNVIKRRLNRLGQLDLERTTIIGGDAFNDSLIDLAKYDVFYVYSPLGKWELDIDEIVDRAKSGAVIIFNRLPVRNRDGVEPLKTIAGMYAFRKR
ncbi:MAG: class I SAM-dependent methyltransferase [Mariniblastus sp.]